MMMMIMIMIKTMLSSSPKHILKRLNGIILIPIRILDFALE